MAGVGSGGVYAVSLMLDQRLEEMFSSHMDGGAYLEKEGKNLGELYGGFLMRFAGWHVSFERMQFETLQPITLTN